MKKSFLIAAFACLSLGSMSSCDSYHSLTTASSVTQLAANPFVQNVAKSVLKNFGNTLIQNGIKDFGKLGLNTNLNSILSTASAVASVKNMLSDNYGISKAIVDKSFNNMGSMRDIISLVAGNATKGVSFSNF